MINIQNKEIQALLLKLRSLLGNQSMPAQSSTSDQLKELQFLANQLGLYDGAEALGTLINK